MGIFLFSIFQLKWSHMLSLIVAHLIVLSTADTPIAKTVCGYNHCVGTRTNPLPKNEIWASMGIIAESGCCAWAKGPCERCVQPYTCYRYKDGENNAWCQAQQKATNGDIVFTNGNNNNYVGCGWCGCCVKTDLVSGLPKNNFGTAPGWVDATQNQVKDWQSDLPKNAAQGARAEAQFAVETESFHVFDYAVYGFATLGFAVIVYGAYKHYSSKTEEENMSML